jgi:hypothetical protein
MSLEEGDISRTVPTLYCTCPVFRRTSYQEQSYPFCRRTGTQTNPGQANPGQTNPGHDEPWTRQTLDTTNPGHIKNSPYIIPVLSLGGRHIKNSPYIIPVHGLTLEPEYLSQTCRPTRPAATIEEVVLL